MQKIYFILSVLVLSFLITSCKEDNPIQNDEPIDEDIVSETIGASGGVLSTENYILKVPPGTFSGSQQISLSVLDSNNLNDDEVVSHIYKLSGLPEDFNDSLRVAIKYEKNIEGGTFITFSSEVEDPLFQDVHTNIEYQEAQDSSGFLIAYLKPHFFRTVNISKSKSHGSTTNIDEILQEAVHKSIKRESNYFVYNCPIIQLSEMENFVESLEGIINLLKTNGIGIIEQYFNDEKKLEIDTEGYLTSYEPINGFYPKLDENSVVTYYCKIDKNAILDAFDISVKYGGRALTRLSLRLVYDQMESPPEDILYHAHFLNAIVSWSEELYSDASFEKPMLFEYNSFAPFLGLKKGLEYSDLDQKIDRGVGISSVFKYLLSFKLNNSPLMLHSDLTAIYELIGKGTDPIAALFSNVNGLKAVWWPDFFNHYLNGEIYGLKASDFIKDAYITRTWNIQTENDTIEEVLPSEIGKSSDLSAKMVLVNQNFAGIDPEKSLLVETTGEATADGLSILAYSYKNESLEFINQVDASKYILKIPNLKSYYDNGINQFLVVVVNSTGIPPYDGESNIYTTLRISGKDDDEIPALLTSNRCKVTINLEGEVKEVKDTTTIQYHKDLGAGVHAAIGSFSENTFVGNWNINLDPLFYTGSVTVTVNEDLTMVTSVTWTEEYKSYSGGDLATQSTYSFAAENLPQYPGSESGVFQIAGEQTCDKLSSITYSAYNHVSSADISLVSYYCDQFSYITILFWEEP